MAILAQRSDILPLQASGFFMQLPDDVQVSLICEDIKRLNTALRQHIKTDGDQFWRNVLFPQFNLAPILYNLLSMPRATATDDAPAQSRELFRLAAILYLCKLWSRFGMDLSGDAVYVAKLRAAWTRHDFFRTWSFDHPLLLWTILVFCTYNRAPAEMRRECGDLLLDHGPKDHSAAAPAPAAIPRSLWCEPALGSLDTVLEDDEARK